MLFEKLIKIPMERIGVVIGKAGQAKLEIEKTCLVELDIDSNTGEIIVKCNKITQNVELFKSIEIIKAIGRGFSLYNAMKLLDDDDLLYVISLRDIIKSTKTHRIKSRIIGEHGKAKKNIETLTGTTISVYGNTISIIGNHNNIKLAYNAILSIIHGSMHHIVYRKLESSRRQTKADKLKIWEDKNEY